MKLQKNKNNFAKRKQFEACDISHKNKYQSYFDYILNLRQIW